MRDIFDQKEKMKFIEDGTQQQRKKYTVVPYRCDDISLACTWCHHFLISKTKDPPKFFFLIRNKRGYLTICLQLFSAVACFVWKPAHFEFQSYGDAWQKATNAFAKKYALISWFLAYSGVKVLGKALVLVLISRLLYFLSSLRRGDQSTVFWIVSFLHTTMFTLFPGRHVTGLCKFL